MQLRALASLFKILYTLVCGLKFTEKLGKIADKYMENLKQASGEI